MSYICSFCDVADTRMVKVSNISPYENKKVKTCYDTLSFLDLIYLPGKTYYRRVRKYQYRSVGNRQTHCCTSARPSAWSSSFGQLLLGSFKLDSHKPRFNCILGTATNPWGQIRTCQKLVAHQQLQSRA